MPATEVRGWVIDDDRYAREPKPKAIEVVGKSHGEFHVNLTERLPCFDYAKQVRRDAIHATKTDAWAAYVERKNGAVQTLRRDLEKAIAMRDLVERLAKEDA